MWTKGSGESSHCETVPRMGLLTDYFSAASDELALTTLRTDGPLHAEPPFTTVELKGIEPSVTLARLAQALTGADYETVTADPDWDRPLIEYDEDDEVEQYVSGVAEKLRLTLTQADDVRLAEAAVQWAQAEEFGGFADPDVLTEIVKELAGLARHATEQGERLYCWVCL